jgi:hypothetical protein
MMSMEEEADEDDGEMDQPETEAETDIAEITLAEVVKAEDQDTLEESLTSHLEDLGGEMAPPLKEKLTRLANEYWSRGSQKGAATAQMEIIKKYPQVERLAVQPISMNVEVFTKLHQGLAFEGHTDLDGEVHLAV